MSVVPQTSPQFKHIKRYWDKRRELPVARILPGELYVTKHHELITTLLGSCVAVCMRDKINKIGGMNHFKLPQPMDGHHDQENTNYGIYAMELLINEILKEGGNKSFFECSIFGGGNVLQGVSNDIGKKNIKFVLDFLQQDGIPVIGQETGHTTGQQVYFHPVSGKTFSAIKDKASLAAIKSAENKYLKQVNAEIDKSSIDYL